MAPPTFLDNSQLWPTIKRLHSKTKRRSMVAVPYVGKGAFKQLPLRDRDVLICALSLTNARAGNVCPAELKIFLNHGVDVYVRTHLHAKVYLFGETAVVASSNLSTSSETRLDECGMLISDRRCVKRVKQWFRERLIDELRPEFLMRCAKVYRPPKGGSILEGGSSKPVWLAAVEAGRFPENENAARIAGEKKARKRIAGNASALATVRWHGKDIFSQGAAREDRFIQIMDAKGDPPVVYPHGTILELRRTRGRSTMYVYLELPDTVKGVRWPVFRDNVAKKTKKRLKLPRNAVLRRIAPRFHDVVLGAAKGRL